MGCKLKILEKGPPKVRHLLVVWIPPRKAKGVQRAWILPKRAKVGQKATSLGQTGKIETLTNRSGTRERMMTTKMAPLGRVGPPNHPRSARHGKVDLQEKAALPLKEMCVAGDHGIWYFASYAYVLWDGIWTAPSVESVMLLLV